MNIKWHNKSKKKTNKRLKLADILHNLQIFTQAQVFNFIRQYLVDILFGFNFKF